MQIFDVLSSFVSSELSGDQALVLALNLEQDLVEALLAPLGFFFGTNWVMS